ncbi:uncharacterized protein DUF2651 [Saliterribacillus persicus]|uniref:Uncharacterized protein DUF2651 n=1 Tax=Saliterribacillus persicus TaxID=930114 RepID=A0A368XYC2_9BACI|nr:uncharacterized protein DUF2651 [Saliterribacillus persicus]
MELFPFIIFIIFVFPMISILIGILGYYIFKNIYIAPILVAIVSVIATFTVFNTSFWFWATLYTLLSLMSALIVKLFTAKRLI